MGKNNRVLKDGDKIEITATTEPHVETEGAPAKKPRTPSSRKKKNGLTPAEAMYQELMKAEVAATPGENARIIRHNLQLATMPPVSLKDPDAVAQRIADFFSICAQHDIKPSVVGLCLALDVSKERMQRILTYAEKDLQEVDPNRVLDYKIYDNVKLGNDILGVCNLVKKAVTIIDSNMVDSLAAGKINPIPGIFLLKTHHGYRETQEINITQSPLGATKDTKELEEKYAESVVIDDADVAEVPPSDPVKP